MQHPDPDDLALFVTSPTGDPQLAAHLIECAACSAEVEAFRQVLYLGPLNNYGADAPHPGAHVWDAIAGELGLRDGGAAQPVAGQVPSELVTERERGREVPAARAPEPAEKLRRLPTKPAGPRRLDPAAPPAGYPPSMPARRRSRWLVPAAALLVGAAIGAGAVALAQRHRWDPVEAATALTVVQGGPVGDPGAQLGQAELVAAGQQQRVVISAAGLPAITGAYEVWLLGNDGRMVSLGALDQGVGDFTVPAGISTTEYRTVDVSDEPADGNPAHSGVSVVRGTLR